MANRIQRIGHTSGAAQTFLGLAREITINTTNNTLIVHDGTTAGGHPAAKADLTNAPDATVSAAGKMTPAQVASLALLGSTGNPTQAAAITALTTRVTATETAATALTPRVTAAETAATALTVRVTATEAAATLLTPRVSATELAANNVAAALIVTNNAAVVLNTRVTATEVVANNAAAAVAGLNLTAISGVTPGTALPSKALILNSDKNVAGVGVITTDFGVAAVKRANSNSGFVAAQTNYFHASVPLAVVPTSIGNNVQAQLPVQTLIPNEARLVVIRVEVSASHGVSDALPIVINFSPDNSYSTITSRCVMLAPALLVPKPIGEAHITVLRPANEPLYLTHLLANSSFASITFTYTIIGYHLAG